MSGGGGGAVVLNRTVRLLVNAGAAKPGASLGQALGPLGLNMAEFCKQFNERTKVYEKDVTLPVKLSGIHVKTFSNRTFTFQIKTPTTSYFIKKCAKIDKGSAKPGHDVVGKIHVKQIYEIAKVKQRDEHLQRISLQSLCRCIAGSAQSMGVEVVSD